jgi:Holliday junction resolvasome RuvABC ATP-dependent DNA helicase subunit
MIIGQESITSRMRIWVATGDHCNALLRGQFGGGKTTIAKWYAESVATEMFYYEICQGQRLYPPEDGEPVILDEIHRLRGIEGWYEYGGVLVGCTTEGAPVSEPMRSRMVELWLQPYSEEELVRIIQLRVPKTPNLAASRIAKRCRGVPRIAINLAREVMSIAKFYSYVPESAGECDKILDSLGFTVGGFTANDKNYLEFLIAHQPVSVRVIAAGLNLPLDTVEQEIEPFLLRKGLINITSRGRIYVS